MSSTALCASGKSQTLVTSGESGSGKTENSKQVFRFLAEIAGAQGPTDGAGPGDVSLQELGQRREQEDVRIASDSRPQPRLWQTKSPGLRAIAWPRLGHKPDRTKGTPDW